VGAARSPYGAFGAEHPPGIVRDGAQYLLKGANLLVSLNPLVGGAELAFDPGHGKSDHPSLAATATLKADMPKFRWPMAITVAPTPAGATRHERRSMLLMMAIAAAALGREMRSVAAGPESWQFRAHLPPVICTVQL